jgi:hypothetical protein
MLSKIDMEMAHKIFGTFVPAMPIKNCKKRSWHIVLHTSWKQLVEINDADTPILLMIPTASH